MSAIKYVPTVFAEPLDSALDAPPTNVQVYDDGPRVRLKKFSLTASGAIAANSIIALTLIPKNARVIEGVVKFSAYGAGRTLDVGLVGADNSGHIDDVNDVADDVDMFLDGIDVSAAGVDTLANMALGDANPLYLTQKDVLLVAKILGNTLPDAGTLEGYILYVVD